MNTEGNGMKITRTPSDYLPLFLFSFSSSLPLVLSFILSPFTYFSLSHLILLIHSLFISYLLLPFSRSFCCTYARTLRYLYIEFSLNHSASASMKSRGRGICVSFSRTKVIFVIWYPCDSFSPVKLWVPLGKSETIPISLLLPPLRKEVLGLCRGAE